MSLEGEEGTSGPKTRRERRLEVVGLPHMGPEPVESISGVETRVFDLSCLCVLFEKDRVGREGPGRIVVQGENLWSRRGSGKHSLPM